jgi:putative transposase
MLGGGKDVAEVCRELQVSGQTYTGGATSSAGLRPTTPSDSRIWRRRTPRSSGCSRTPSWRRAALKEIARGNF